MTITDFKELVDLVLETGVRPPKSLFSQGFDDWHARARLAHFLCMPEYERQSEGVAFFRSIVDAKINEENPEDVEEKVFALQKLSACLRDGRSTLEESLQHINAAIELAESTDYLYKYILRGELWSDRWITLQKLGNVAEALAETDERIAAYEDIPIDHNSYLYYGYRFKAQVAGKNGTTLIAKDFMHKALSYMDIPESYKEGLDVALAASHDNISWILSEVDRATPPLDKAHWDI